MVLQYSLLLVGRSISSSIRISIHMSIGNRIRISIGIGIRIPHVVLNLMSNMCIRFSVGRHYLPASSDESVIVFGFVHDLGLEMIWLLI